MMIFSLQRVGEMRMKKSVQTSCGIGFLMAIMMAAGVSTAFSQSDGFSARSTGMARTFTASSRGLDALGMNPANLALSDRGSSVEFTIVPPVGIRLSSNFLSLDLYNNYFAGVDSLDRNGNPTGKLVGRKWTEADKTAILGRMENGMANIDMNVSAMLFGAVVHAGSFGIGFSVSDHIGVAVGIPDSYMKFAFYGLDTAGSQYNFAQTSLNSLWYREYNLSTGVLLPIETKVLNNVAIGVGVKMIKGFNYISTIRNNSRLVSTAMSESMSITGTADLEVQHAGIPLDSTAAENIMNPGGTGLGFDFGLSGQVFHGIRFAAGVLNVGSIRWSGPNNRRIVNTGSYSWAASKYDQAELDRVKTSIDSVFTSRETAGEDFSSQLPTSVHIGTSVDLRQVAEAFPLPLNLAADVHFGLNDVPGNYIGTLVGLGAELNLFNGWLPLRMGVLLGGRDKFLWSGGVGFHFFNSFDLDLATESLSILTAPTMAKTGSFSMAMKVRI
jgi:hypothetical protein